MVQDSTSRTFNRPSSRPARMTGTSSSAPYTVADLIRGGLPATRGLRVNLDLSQREDSRSSKRESWIQHTSAICFRDPWHRTYRPLRSALPDPPRREQPIDNVREARGRSRHRAPDARNGQERPISPREPPSPGRRSARNASAISSTVKLCGGCLVILSTRIPSRSSTWSCSPKTPGVDHLFELPHRHAIGDHARRTVT